jgi:tetratricopeptide (TPR) repeat protein
VTIDTDLEIELKVRTREDDHKAAVNSPTSRSSPRSDAGHEEVLANPGEIGKAIYPPYCIMKLAFPLVLPFVAAIILVITLPSCSKDAKKERSLESAMKYFESGDFAAAEIEFKNALDSAPGNPEAIKYIGLIREAQGATFEAAGILTQAKQKLPNDDEVGVSLSKTLLGLGFIPDSRKELLEVLDRSPENGEALVQLAESAVTQEWMEECRERIKKSGKKTTSSRLASVLIELRSGNMEEGTALVEEILKFDPGSARAHALKASILSSKKQPDEALAELKTAADSGGLRSSESLAYARMLMARERKDEAVAYLGKITTATPDFLPAWALLGQIALSAKDDELATKHFTKVLSKNPADMISAMAQADILMRGKQGEKAMELLEKVATALPGRPQLELALAKSCIAADKVAKAAGILDRILAAAPEFAEAVQTRAAIYLQNGKAADAIGLLEPILKKTPEDSTSLDILIRAYRAAGRNDEAIALLRDKAEGDDQTAANRVELGRMLGSQGKLDEARSIFEGAVETFADDLTAVSNLAGVDLKEGKGDAALKRMEDFIASHPDSSEAYTFKAGIALSLKKLEVAEQALEKAIELNPKSTQAYGLLLQMKSGSGQETEALAVIDRFLQVFPGDPRAMLQRGYLLQVLGRNEDARAAFTALIEAKPEFAAAYNNLASLEAEVFSNVEGAAVHARKARSLDAAQPAIADTLGWIEWQLGNYPAALALLTEAAEKLGENPEVQYHLGMAHYSMGQADQATAALTKAVAASTEFPQKADAQKYLTLLGGVGNATLEELQKQVAENPKDVMSLLQLAGLLASSGRAEESLEVYQKALEANPAIPAALVGQARLHGGPLNSPEKALKAATAARELAPRDPQVLAALGFVKMMVGEHEEAYGLLKDAAVVLDDEPSVTFDYARAAYSLGRITEARTAMTRAAAVKSPIAGDAKNFLLLTDAEALAGSGIAAEVEKTLAKDPKNVAALMLRGALDEAGGKSSEATYLEILKIHSRFDPARVRLAAFYMEDPAKLDQALLLAREARVSMTEDLELAGIFALINYRKGDFKYAAQLYAELSIGRPLVAGELFAYGLALMNSDQAAKARTTLEDALRAGLPEADAAVAKEALSKLE